MRCVRLWASDSCRYESLSLQNSLSPRSQSYRLELWCFMLEFECLIIRWGLKSMHIECILPFRCFSKIMEPRSHHSSSSESLVRFIHDFVSDSDIKLDPTVLLLRTCKLRLDSECSVRTVFFAAPDTKVTQIKVYASDSCNAIATKCIPFYACLDYL